MTLAKQLGGIERALGRIEGAQESFHERAEAVEEAAIRLEKRTRSLENFRWYVAGMFAFGSALVGFIFLN